MAAKQKMPMRPTFPDAVLAETAMLSHEEKGVLGDIENYMWLHGGWLPDDDRELCKLIRLDHRRWKAIKPRLSTRFSYVDGKFTSMTLHNDLDRARHRAEQNRINGASGARKRRSSKETDAANAMAKPDAPRTTKDFASLLHEVTSETINRIA